MKGMDTAHERDMDATQDEEPVSGYYKSDALVQPAELVMA